MKTFLVLFKNGAIREFTVPDRMEYYRHNLLKELNEDRFIAFDNLIIAADFISSIEDITEELK